MESRPDDLSMYVAAKEFLLLTDFRIPLFFSGISRGSPCLVLNSEV
jgi:hypothetical protein